MTARHLDGNSRFARSLVLALVLLLVAFNATAAECQHERVVVQVLGSGGPELTDKRASTAYLVWLDGKARVLLDAGSGSALRFEQSGARFSDLDVWLFSHFHSDHSADFPTFVMGAFFAGRERDLPVFGPTGSKFFPSTEGFAEAMIGDQDRAAFRYLSNYLGPQGDSDYKLRPRSIPVADEALWSGFRNDRLSVSAIPVHHGPVPALAWRVDIAGCAIGFSGDMSGRYETLPLLAKGADLLVAHNAIPEGTLGFAQVLHMPPSVIGEQSAAAGARKLVLSHRMLRTLGKEQETLRIVHEHYRGPVEFADDLDRFSP